MDSGPYCKPGLWSSPCILGSLFWGGEEGRTCPPGVTVVLFPQGKRYKNSLETVGTPDSGRGRSEKKAIK
jgi:hypothetical protein